MAHMLRKYMSNRGSALFMVISTMTALFISCMAMYFSMVAARSSQDAVFNKMQANQSAVSISDVVISALSDDTHPLYQEAMKLKKGESITTDANGFRSLDPNDTSLDKHEGQLGSYAVTITCIDYDGDGNPIVDVMIVTSVDGNRQSIHRTTGLGYNVTGGGGADGSGGDAELFAATGYVPNDAYILNGYFITDVFYDTQYTYIATFGGGSENRIGQGISTGGSLMFNEGAMSLIHDPKAYSSVVDTFGPTTWAIRGDFYFNISSDYAVRGGSKFLVGGNFIRDGGNSLFSVKNDGYNGIETLEDHVSIYVNGDFDYCGSDLRENTWVFVNGNVLNIGPNKQTNAKIFVTNTGDGIAAKTATLSTSTPIYEWPVSGSFADGLTYDEAMELLGQKTATIPYYKWDISKNTDGAEKIDIRLNSSRKDNDTFTDDLGDKYEPGENCYIISYDDKTSSAGLLKSQGGVYPGVIGNKFIINSVWTRDSGDYNVGQAIIIDTGDNPDNIITIQLTALNDDGIFSWFMERETIVESWWDPEIGGPRYSYGKFYPPGDRKPARSPRLLLIRGRGTVLVDVPKGVTYQDANYQQTLHQSWFLAEGGKISTEIINGKEVLDFELDANGQNGDKVIKYIHKECNPDKDGCEFEYKDIDTECGECGEVASKMKQVTCKIHGDVNTFCDNCHHEKADRKDWCINHVDKAAFDNFYKGLGDMQKYAQGADGEIVYPTVNIMLVSCEESAEMLFSQMKDGSSITSNSFFGFVYAPYMSFLARGGSGGGFLKICGGMTVGDYEFDSTHSYMGCYPDRMPNQLAAMEGGVGGSMAGGKLTGATKNWKIVVGGYR